MKNAGEITSEAVRSPGANLSRRAALTRVLAGGAAASLTQPALAQRCDAPKPHTGPAVYLDLDQNEIDEAYDNDLWAFNVKNIDARRKANNAIAQKILGKPLRLAYGEAEIEKLDVYKAKNPQGPTLIFIHGGSWRNGSSSQFAVYAEPFVKAGANFIVVDFTSVKETKGDLFPMVDQCRRAVAWIYRNAASFGANADRLFLCSRSSGSHLSSCVLISEWEKQGLPRDIVKGAVMGSGMYDLKPVSMSKRSGYVSFTDATVEQLSAIRYVDRIHTPVFLGNGGAETREFLRQSRDFANALRAAGKPVQQVVAEGYNHYETGETIGNPYALLGRAAMDMMGLNQL